MTPGSHDIQQPEGPGGAAGRRPPATVNIMMGRPGRQRPIIVTTRMSLTRRTLSVIRVRVIESTLRPDSGLGSASALLAAAATAGPETVTTV